MSSSLCANKSLYQNDTSDITVSRLHCRNWWTKLRIPSQRSTRKARWRVAGPPGRGWLTPATWLVSGTVCWCTFEYVWIWAGRSFGPSVRKTSGSGDAVDSEGRYWKVLVENVKEDEIGRPDDRPLRATGWTLRYGCCKSTISKESQILVIFRRRQEKDFSSDLSPSSTVTGSSRVMSKWKAIRKGRYFSFLEPGEKGCSTGIPRPS